MQTFKKIFFLLSDYEFKKARLLLVMILIMAIFETLGVVSILPFIAVLTDPSLVDTNSILNSAFKISNMYGIKTEKDFLFVLGIVVFILLISSLAIKTFTTYLQIQFVQICEHSLSKRLLSIYLNKPYSWFLSNNSADIGKTILSEVTQVIGSGINQMIHIIAKGIVVMLLILVLFIANPKLSLVISLILFLVYLLLFRTVRQYIKKIGKSRLIKNGLRFKVSMEAFGAIKEIKLKGLEKDYISNFSDAAKTYALTQSHSQALGQLPRYLLEGVSFGGVLILILFLMSQSNSINSFLPILSFYIFAGYRLLPSFQQIYNSFTKLTYVGPSLDKLSNDLKNVNSSKENIDQDFVSFKNNIALKNISYCYPNASKNALNNISLVIPKNSTVGFIGTTGSGKTTIVDIIIGLIEPQKGFLEIDNKVISKNNLRSWQNLIGYVPQHIYLLDDTIEANITFGTKTENIDKEALQYALKIANLDKFVSDLPEKYQTKIGERGVRLSGGQRQRIGIARAMYQKPKVLIFDEATSALDNQTEHAVMEAINNLNKKITIILIAHRLTSVKNCDTIFQVEKSRIIKRGTLDEIFI